MAQLKIDLIQQAYSRLRISGLTVNPTPDDMELALLRLESMIAEFNSRNITTEYRISPSDNPDPNEPSGLDKRFWDMVSSNLAIRLCSDFGKDVPQTLMSQASLSLSTASSSIAIDTVRMVRPSRRTPLGEANTLRTRTRQRFYREPVLPPENAELNHMFIGDINDYKEDFASYLRVGEFITEMDFLANDGLTLLETDNDSPYITYRVQAVSQLNIGPWQQVRIIVTTNLGRKTTRIINFEVAIPVTMEGVQV